MQIVGYINTNKDYLHGQKWNISCLCIHTRVISKFNVVKQWNFAICVIATGIVAVFNQLTEKKNQWITCLYLSRNILRKDCPYNRSRYLIRVSYFWREWSSPGCLFKVRWGWKKRWTSGMEHSLVRPYGNTPIDESNDWFFSENKGAFTRVPQVDQRGWINEIEFNGWTILFTQFHKGEGGSRFQKWRQMNFCGKVLLWYVTV